MDKGSRGGTEWGPYFLSLVRGVSRQTCSELKDSNYLDLLGKAGATAGQLPICQLLANWYDTLRNPKSALRDLLISGRIYTWFLRFLELIEFSLEYFLPSPSALNCAWVKVHSGVTRLTKSAYLGASISFPHPVCSPSSLWEPGSAIHREESRNLSLTFLPEVTFIPSLQAFYYCVVLHIMFSLRFFTFFCIFCNTFFSFSMTVFPFVISLVLNTLLLLIYWKLWVYLHGPLS